MPVLRCTNPECEEEWTVTSRLAIGSECPFCESETVEVMDDDDPPERQQVPTGPKRGAVESEGGARLAFARGAARKLLRDNKIVAPPIPVPALVRRLGLELEPRATLGPLRARLRDSTIEYDKDAPPVALRFAFAHEIGHYCMGTTHDSGPFVEEEANAYANELLVPGHMLHAALEHTAEEAELRKRFQVSGQVLEIAATVHQVAGRITRS
jgi:hypothetical protein